MLKHLTGPEWATLVIIVAVYFTMVASIVVMAAKTMIEDYRYQQRRKNYSKGLK